MTEQPPLTAAQYAAASLEDRRQAVALLKLRAEARNLETRALEAANAVKAKEAELLEQALRQLRNQRHPSRRAAEAEAARKARHLLPLLDAARQAEQQYWLEREHPHVWTKPKAVA